MITLLANSCHNLASNDLQKLSDTQSILMYHSVLKVKKIVVLRIAFCDIYKTLEIYHVYSIFVTKMSLNDFDVATVRGKILEG